MQPKTPFFNNRGYLREEVPIRPLTVWNREIIQILAWQSLSVAILLIATRSIDECEWWMVVQMEYVDKYYVNAWKKSNLL